MNRKKVILFLLAIMVLFFISSQTIVQADVIVKNTGNTTLFYSKNTLIARYRVKNMSNGLVEVETCHNGYCKYTIMTPMQAQTFRQNFQDRIKRIVKVDEEIAARRQKADKERAVYIQEQKTKHKNFIKEVEEYQKNLSVNLDFKVKNSCNASKNTLIVDSYAVFAAPKEKFDLIPEGALFDSNLQRVWQSSYGATFVGYADLADMQELKINNYSCYQRNNPVFIKETLSPEGDERYDAKVARFNFIKNGRYKDFAMYMDCNYARKYAVGYDGITVDDAKTWFEDYKNFLAPYLEEYQKIKNLVAQANKEEKIEFRRKLNKNSLEVQKKYPNKTVGDLINDKQKMKLRNDYYKNIKSLLVDWNFTLDELFNLKLGSYYLAKGVELKPDDVDDNFLDKENYFLANKDLVNLLKRAAKASDNKTLEVNLSIYKQHVFKRIEDNWKRYKDSDVGDITISFKVAKSGKLLNYSIIKSSGNIKHDKDLVKALWYSSPFEIFPTNFSDEEIDFEFTFYDKPEPEPSGYNILQNK